MESAVRFFVETRSGKEGVCSAPFRTFLPAPTAWWWGHPARMAAGVRGEGQGQEGLAVQSCGPAGSGQGWGL